MSWREHPQIIAEEDLGYSHKKVNFYHGEEPVSSKKIKDTHKMLKKLYPAYTSIRGENYIVFKHKDLNKLEALVKTIGELWDKHYGKTK